MNKEWLIRYLTIEVMTKKFSHWEDLFRKLNMPEVEYASDITFKYLEEIGMLNHEEEILDYSKRVEK
jgi:hypothetical protein